MNISIAEPKARVQHLIKEIHFFFDVLTHWSRDEVAWEQVPEGYEERQSNLGNLIARSQCHKHHSEHGEIGEAHEYEVAETKEFVSLPIESNHWIYKNTIRKSLDCNINCLYSHLCHRKDRPISKLSCPRKRIHVEENQLMLTCANAYGSSEYIPAALSR